MFNKIYENIKNYIKDNYKFLITLVLIIAIFWVRLPFLIYTPGGTVDLDNRIIVEDKIDKEGKFQMAYVSMVRGSIPFILASYVIPNWDLVKESEIVIEEESVGEMIKRDQIFLKQSIDDAVINAYRLANKNVEITDVNNHVIFIHDEARTDLKLFDEILVANGKEINSLEEYLEIVNSSTTGEIIKLQVLRNNKKIDAQAEVVLIDDKLKTGLSIINTYEYKTTPNIEINSKKSESGS